MSCRDHKPCSATTERQHAYVLAYTGPAKGNGTHAHRMSAPKGSTPSERVSSSQSAKWLANPRVAKSIRWHQARVQQRVEAKEVVSKTEAAEVMAEIMHHGDRDRDRIGSAAELAKFFGWYAATKTMKVPSGLEDATLLMIQASDAGNPEAVAHLRAIEEGGGSDDVVMRETLAWLLAGRSEATT